MKKTLTLGTVLLAATSLLVFSACRKDKTEVAVGGKGGTAIIKATPMHHDKIIDSCKIFIKYNTQDAPANSKYDDSAVCVLEAGTPVATFTGLKAGNYYLYGYGYDPAILQAVKGGTKITITDTINANVITVPVTEGD